MTYQCHSMATSALEAAYAKLPPLEDVPLEDIVHVSERQSGVPSNSQEMQFRYF